jgi:hypothetical protein
MNDFWYGIEGIWVPVCLRRDLHGTSLELERPRIDRNDSPILLIAWPKNSFKRLLLRWLKII